MGSFQVDLSKKKKLPATKVIKFDIDPKSGFAGMAAVTLKAPKGYVFEKMDRKGNKAVITYRRIDP